MSSRWSHADAPRGDDYDARWRALAASGKNPHGEVDFVQRYQPRRVLDAGCGTGRVAIELDRRGVAVVGVDLDPEMLATARSKAPHLRWHLADLAQLDLRDGPARERFDVVVAAGNVMIFLEPGSEPHVLQRMAEHLHPGGRVITGFQLSPGRFSLADLDAATKRCGLVLEDRFATWDADPFTERSDYAVSVLRTGTDPG